MNRFRIVILAITVSLAASAAMAVAAQAEEGPFYKISGVRLAAGQEKSTTSALSKEYVLTAATDVIDCKKMELENGKVIGSTGANAGTSSEVIVYRECSVTGNGTPCEPFSEKNAGTPEPGVIRTNAVKNSLAFTNKASKVGEVLLTVFQPASGAVFVTVKFKGTGCKVTSTAVEGKEGVAAEDWSTGATPEAVKVGSEPVRAVTGEVRFPATPIKEDFIETGGLRAAVKPSLKAFGVAATLVGRSTVEIEGLEWCISTGTAGTKCN
jgi:hypothetical protein